jgi:hypothetical protein
MIAQWETIEVSAVLFLATTFRSAFGCAPTSIARPWTESGGLGTVGKWQDAWGASGGSRGSGAARFVLGFRGNGRFLRRFSGGGSWGGVYRGSRIGLLFNADQILIRDFPAEVLVLAALFELLFEEDGTTGIGDEYAGGRQKDIAGAILHLHPAPEKRRVASHPVLSFGGR